MNVFTSYVLGLGVGLTIYCVAFWRGFKQGRELTGEYHD